MKRSFLSSLWVLLVFVNTAFSQYSFFTEEVEMDSLISGSLYEPKGIDKPPLIIMIAGSGPTDRNGNTRPSVINNSLKFLAEGLAKKGIACFSYDKRIFAQMKNNTLDESDLRFEDMVEDATNALNFFRNKDEYKSIFLLGHSEGSTIGLLAAQNGANGFISVAGPGRNAAEILIEQISKNAPMLVDDTKRILEALARNEDPGSINPFLVSLFRPSVQPYLKSWMKYDPAIEISKLNMPILIVQGDKDIQVSAIDAENLYSSATDSKLYIIKNMNHVLKIIEGDLSENIASYTNPDLPVAEQLVDVIVQFVGN